MTVDALQPPTHFLGDFDVIVCNPPYIRSGDIPGLDVSVRDYEPLLALDGGADGLEFYRYLAQHWKLALRRQGTFLFEVGYDQAEDVSQTSWLSTGIGTSPSTRITTASSVAWKPLCDAALTQVHT